MIMKMMIRMIADGDDYHYYHLSSSSIITKIFIIFIATAATVISVIIVLVIIIIFYIVVSIIITNLFPFIVQHFPLKIMIKFTFFNNSSTSSSDTLSYFSKN